MECEECSERCELRSGASHVTCETGQLSQNARMHGPGWRTAHASSVDEKALIYP